MSSAAWIGATAAKHAAIRSSGSPNGMPLGLHVELARAFAVEERLSSCGLRPPSFSSFCSAPVQISPSLVGMHDDHSKSNA